MGIVCKCTSCRVKIVQKLAKRSPLKYKLTQAASYLNHSSILAATDSLSALWHLRPLAYCFISTAADLSSDQLAHSAWFLSFSKIRLHVSMVFLFFLPVPFLTILLGF
ncbi:hypothetical protein CEXT_554741 [Caerostris extrusa]|uniref:Uncharacterized protein n=1 Tax=Caerostris extrusa TaxID=172846 RepID=A0AAV4S7W7_CAEEX|nr:hypothetical protein CEXT_554741 [Caerostris extrusa]